LETVFYGFVSLLLLVLLIPRKLNNCMDTDCVEVFFVVAVLLPDCKLCHFLCIYLGLEISLKTPELPPNYCSVIIFCLKMVTRTIVASVLVTDNCWVLQNG